MGSIQGRNSASVASALSGSEVADLAALALGLPESWCVQIVPPYGQLSIAPLVGRPRYQGCFTAVGADRIIMRENGLAYGPLRYVD